MKYYGQASKYISFYNKYKHTLKDPTTDRDMWGDTVGDITYPDKHFDRFILDKMLDIPLTVENMYNSDTYISLIYGRANDSPMELEVTNGEIMRNTIATSSGRLVTSTYVKLKPHGKVSYYGHIDPRQNSMSGNNGFSGAFYIYGNVMSLVHGRNFRNNTEMLHDGEFQGLIQQSNSYMMQQKPGTCLVFPSKVLRKNCYNGLLAYSYRMNRIAILAEDVSAENCMYKFTSGIYAENWPRILYIKKDTIYPDTVFVKGGYTNEYYYSYLPPTVGYNWRFVKV